jgi:tartrate dehydratase beta subunit/fumarate hydratase class I family protein
MKKNTILSLAIGLVLTLGLAGCSQTSNTNTSQTENSTTQKIAEIMVPTVLAQNENFVYEDFSQKSFDALKGKEAFAVFVHSKSCGTCAKKNKQIIEEIEQFNVGKILKMEYSDAPMEFVKTYEVNKYDTFVMFDAQGNATTVKGASVEDVREAL